MRILTLLCLLLVAVALSTSLAHALEWPGKRRLDERAYAATQTIYYPGFTFAGLIGEFGGMAALGVALLLTPFGAPHFWWGAAALVLMLAAHAVYWLLTHPVNKFWVKDVARSAVGSAFFTTFAGTHSGDWTQLRDRWERSHAVRAALHLLSVLAIGVALTHLP